MSSPPGTRRRVHSEAQHDFPNFNHTTMDGKAGMAVAGTTNTPSPKKQRNKKRRANRAPKLYLFFSACCGIVVIPLCYVKLAYYLVSAGPDTSSLNAGGTTAYYDLPKIRGSDKATIHDQASHHIPRILIFTHYRDL